MTTTKTTIKRYDAAREKTDTIVEWLLYGWDKKYVTPDAIRQGTGLDNKTITWAVRRLITTFGALRYNRIGEYEIVDLELYFQDEIPAGAELRAKKRYIK